MSDSGVIYIKNHPWYFLLKQKTLGARALLSDYPESSLYQHLVVCFMPKILPGYSTPFITSKGKPGRLFGFFESYIEYYKYSRLFDPSERAFFEIIFGSLPQKPRFDIDIEADVYINDTTIDHETMTIDNVCDTLLDSLIDKCIVVLEGLGITIKLERDILLYSSHSDYKRSYHLVINNYCHASNEEARAFYETVIDLMKVELPFTSYIDRSVYSPVQQFRIAGCQKQYSGRPKQFHEKFYFKDIIYQHEYDIEFDNDDIKRLTILLESLVSFTSGCSYIPSLVVVKPPRFNLEGPELDDEKIDKCMELMYNVIDPAPFKLNEVNGTLLILQRMAPSLCPLCKRIHEGENPFIFISMGNAYWNCRRNPRENLLLGKVYDCHIQLYRYREFEPAPIMKQFTIDTVTNKTTSTDVVIRTDVAAAINNTERKWNKQKESSICVLNSVMDNVPWGENRVVILDEEEPPEIGKRAKSKLKKAAMQRTMMDDMWSSVPWS